MPVTRVLTLAALGAGLAGCVAPQSGYWDARLAELPLAYNYGCRNALAVSNAQDATLYCPRDMPLPPNGVWKPGLAR
jgi:hypothetical protein